MSKGFEHQGADNDVFIDHNNDDNNRNADAN